MGGAPPLFGLAVENHPGTDGGVGEPVDDDKAAGATIAPVGVVADRLGERDRAAPDLIEGKSRRVLAVEGVDVDAVAERAHGAAGDLRRLLEEIGLPGEELLLGHPHDHRLKAVVDLRLIAGADEHVAAAGIDLVFEGQRHALRREGLFPFAVEGDDLLHPALLPGGEAHHLVAGADDAGGDRAAEAAEIEIRPEDELDREAEVLEIAVGADVDRLQERHQRGAGEPRHVRAVGDDVVAFERRDRQEVEVGELQPRSEGSVVSADLLEDSLVVADDVHLVDGDDDMPDPQERDDEAVAARLREDSVTGVDEDDGQIGRRSPRRHVARVLLVAGGVGDDELALVGGEVAVGDVDRDSLLPLILEAVGEQRQIDLVAGRAVARGIPGDRRELVLIDHLRFVEQPADERALAVVDAPAGDKPQQLLALVLGEVFVDVVGDERGLMGHA